MTITFTLPRPFLQKLLVRLNQFAPALLILGLSALSVWCFAFFLQNNLGLAYNDARSHLDIGRRVVEGLKPGLAQLGSVWLPLPHILMVPTIWNDYFWHTGLSGAIQSMVSFVLTGYIIYRLLEKIGVGMIGRLFAVVVFATNLNILYLQSTAMTELLLLATMTMAVYQLVRWYQTDTILTLVKVAFWVMMATLVRYDGWFLGFYATLLVILKPVFVNRASLSRAIKKSEGLFFLFCTLAGFGIFGWVVWNALIFKDPFYFAFGPFSAHAQQAQLESAGVLQTKGNWFLSLITYWYAMVFNMGIVPLVLGLIGAVLLLIDKKNTLPVKVAMSALFAPLVFNMLALYLGHSVLFVQNLNGNTWFNVRYGIMMMPSVAVFAGYLFHRARNFRPLILGIFIFFAVFHLAGWDAVTVDDGRVGSSQKNVSQVSGWLQQNAKDRDGFVLISAASHDAIIFSSQLPMKKYIHEGTGGYWLSATTAPDRWARWVVMRTNDRNDLVFRALSDNKTDWEVKYTLVATFPFADIYELRPEYLPELQTKPVLGKQK